MSRDNLPGGWRLATLGDVAMARTLKVTPSAARDLPHVGLEHLAPGRSKLLGVARAEQMLSQLAVFRKGDILFGKLRPALRKLVRVAFDGYCSTDIIPIAPKDERSGAYLAQLLGQESFFSYALRDAIGTKMPRTSWGYVSAYAFPCPPVAEQTAIATVLDSFDDAIERTEEVIAATERLRTDLLQDLLTNGVPGRHTAWKEVPGIGRVPACWDVVRLGDVTTEFRYGTSVRCTTNPSDGWPVLRIPNVVQGRVDTADLKYGSLSNAEERTTQLVDGDILVVRTNGNPELCGRCSVVHGLTGDWSYASYLIRVRVAPARVSPEYVSLYLNAPVGRKTLGGSIRTSAGNYNLSVEGLSAAVIATPPLAEQHEIIKAVQGIRERSNHEQALLKQMQWVKRAVSGALLTGQTRLTMK